MNLQEQIDDLRGLIKELTNQVHDFGLAVASLTGELRAVPTRIDNLTAEVHAVDVTAAGLSGEFKGLSGQFKNALRVGAALAAATWALVIPVGIGFYQLKGELRGATRTTASNPDFLSWPAEGRAQAAPDNAMDIYPNTSNRRAQAIFNGRVVECDLATGHVVIEFGGNQEWTATYDNLSNVPVRIRKERPVTLGQGLGEVSMGKALRFSVRYGGNPIHPLAYPLPEQGKPLPKP